MSETTITDTSTISTTNQEATITEGLSTTQPVAKKEIEEVTTNDIIHAKLENVEHENKLIGSAKKEIKQFTIESSSLNQDFTAGMYCRN